MSWSVRVRASAAAILGVVVAAVLVQPAVAEPDMVSVIVRSEQSTGHAAAAVRDAGGDVELTLEVIDGVAAELPVDRVADLRAADLTVTPDERIQPLADSRVDTTQPVTVRTVVEVTGAEDYWASGATGAGVGVALIDTGVAPVQGLDAGQVRHGPDLSFEANAPELRHLDTYGHGTHMAGLIVGRDADAHPTRPDADGFLGMAPDAHLISLKVADAHGVTDVSQVIAAIDWVVTHHDDPDLNIRVLNLSYGTYSRQRYTTDPLSHAAEAAWDAGIVVVAAAGNDGDTVKGLTTPAIDPRILAVGAVDTNDSSLDWRWRPLSFSARGDGSRNPDLLAPGASVSSLRVPGSQLDLLYGDTATVDERFFKGSGTSQSAAIVSGAAALVVGANPRWTPDMVKAALLANGDRLGREFTPETGQLALRLDTMAGATPPNRIPTHRPSAGGGDLDATRGDAVLVTADGVELTGNRDLFGQPLDTAALAKGLANGGTWVDGVWNGNQWTGHGWDGLRWMGQAWTGTDWAGHQWSGHQWSGHQWSGHQWSGGEWAGHQWSGHQWSGHQWSNATWSSASWR